MQKTIRIESEFTDAVRKEKALRSVGASISENLLHFVRFGQNVLFAMCENQLFWHCEFNKAKSGFECYDLQGKIERNKNLPASVSFEDKKEKAGRREKSFTTMTIKNDLITRRFDLNFVLTEEEKTALRYFFESYFKDEPVSENFRLPKESLRRIIGLRREAFGERLNNFFGKSGSDGAKGRGDSDKESRRTVARTDVKDPEPTTPIKTRKSPGEILGCVDFLADIAFLFAAVCLLKSDFWATQAFDDKFPWLNFFSELNVLKVYTLCSAGIFVILKLLVIAFARNSLKASGILMLLIQAITLLLISPMMSARQMNSVFSLLLFITLNLLLYFCLQLLVGNVFSCAFQKFISLIFCALIMFLIVTALQTISSYVDLSDFGSEFIRNLSL